MLTKLTMRDVANHLGIKKRTIQYWTDVDLVIPDHLGSTGKGRALIYSNRNLIEFAMLDVMAKVLDVRLEKIAFILQFLRMGF